MKFNTNKMSVQFLILKKNMCTFYYKNADQAEKSLITSKPTLIPNSIRLSIIKKKPEPSITDEEKKEKKPKKDKKEKEDKNPKKQPKDEFAIHNLKCITNNEKLPLPGLVKVKIGQNSNGKGGRFTGVSQSELVSETQIKEFMDWLSSNHGEFQKCLAENNYDVNINKSGKTTLRLELPLSALQHFQIISSSSSDTADGIQNESITHSLIGVSFSYNHFPSTIFSVADLTTLLA